MSYAIIGSGAIGSAIASHFARIGQDVRVANSRGAAAVGELAARLGPHVQPSDTAQALQADVVILAVPFGQAAQLAAGVGDWQGRIVVDATNAVDFPAFTPSDLGGRASTQVLAEALPGARVVKAFNTLPAAVLAQSPDSDGGRRVLFVSGDDAQANRSVAALAQALGFDAIVLGAIGAGGLLQQFGGPLVAQNLSRHG
ncbi:NAD(P)-binding domain-containing protein [Xanthomonas sp. AmX2]|uniref:NADPH-dependent F420 reductase n=1 Tax=Xanthomonas sp. TaxID=29446 RepID=UPI0019819C54|nr:NAD(P)-binding domain-containing protein [Xanthomonas sp.]MBN6151021.1 NAD(P)-binding domain-containing protein [Xanthomonas sp.]